jgi:formyltetrahydrofolate-dependent phosphoribosylglycinamide formyltransferase
MFERLKEKWKVNGWGLLIILLTFALAGTGTGYLGKLLMNALKVRIVWVYILIYVVVITFLWPFMVIITSLLFGQFHFFRNYLWRIWNMMTGLKKTDSQLDTSGKRDGVRLAIFASGTGTNAKRIIEHFRDHRFIKISLLVSNKQTAGAISIAAQENIPTLIIEKEKFFRGNGYVEEIRGFGIDLIILAGFLWKLPASLVSAWNHRIINIHPALLPKYGGKGLYGHHVHEAVINAKEKESGITIHYVDEIYDHGQPILQEKVVIEENDTAETLSKKVQALEHLHFPKVIEEVAKKLRL